MTNNSEQSILQKNLAQFLIEDVFNTISEQDVLKIKAPGVWEHKGKVLTEGQIRSLQLEADAFADSAIWKVLKTELIWLAHETGYIKSKTTEDQVAGKLLEYLTNVIDSRLRSMRSQK